MNYEDVHARRVTSVPIETRYAIVNATNLTLDGVPAKVSGALNSQCCVWTLPRVGEKSNAAMFSWEAAERIWSENNGEFKS